MGGQSIEQLRREAALASRLWVKVLGMLEQNWCLLEQAPDGATLLLFFDDHGKVFDWLSAPSYAVAHAELQANGFTWLRESPSFIHTSGMPNLPGVQGRRHTRPVYSSGQFWQSGHAAFRHDHATEGLDTGEDDLQRFVRAQDPHWYEVAEELAAGRKQGHWMWFVFPQLRGLGSSHMARRFGLRWPQEAAAYWDDEVLGNRLRTCIGLLLELPEGTRAERVFGAIDALKLRSCLTIFENASLGDDSVVEALERFCGSERCGWTLEKIATEAPARHFRFSR